MIAAATAISAWPAALRALALPFERVDVSAGDHLILQDSAAGRPAAPLSADLGVRLAAALQTIGGPVHLRLDRGSFKQAGFVPCCRTVEDIERVLMARNPRVAQVLSDPGPLYLFPWCQIAPGHEFRIFLRARQIVGISQMLRRRDGALQVGPARGAAEPILRDFGMRLAQASPLANAAADVMILRGAAGLTCQLIELNPLVRRTDPGLFCHVKNDFDGSLRLAATPETCS